MLVALLVALLAACASAQSSESIRIDYDFISSSCHALGFPQLARRSLPTTTQRPSAWVAILGTLVAPVNSSAQLDTCFLAALRPYSAFASTARSFGRGSTQTSSAAVRTYMQPSPKLTSTRQPSLARRMSRFLILPSRRAPATTQPTSTASAPLRAPMATTYRARVLYHVCPTNNGSPLDRAWTTIAA